MKQVLVIDGHNYLYRSYHVLKVRNDPARYLLSRIPEMIMKTIRDTGIKDVIVVFDPSTENWRHDVYTEYKANRDGMPDDMKEVFPAIRKLIRVLGLPVVREKRMEGDDLLGTLATQLHDRGWDVYVATSDKDMAQLVKKRISLVNKDNEVLDKQGIIDKYGVEPKKVIDWLAVCGDKVDNVPGVLGVGEKSVKSILSQSKSIRKAMKKGIVNLEGIRGAAGVHKKIEEQWENFELSHVLVTIKTDLDIECPKPGRAEKGRKYEEKLEKYLAKFTG